jgi:hypothetical protein
MKAPWRQAPLDTPTQMWQPFRRRSMEWNDSGSWLAAGPAGVSHVQKGRSHEMKDSRLTWRSRSKNIKGVKERLPVDSSSMMET